MKSVAGIFVLCAAIFVFGCAKTQTGQVVKVPEAGLTMTAPSGWKAQGGDSALACFKGDSTCIVLVEPLEGRDFKKYAREIATAFGGKEISSEALSVSGCEAFRFEVEYPLQGSKSLRLYVQREDELVEVSFVTPSEEFQIEKAALSQALDSVKIK